MEWFVTTSAVPGDRQRFGSESMKVVHEDIVDWEPLQMRFRLKGTPTPDRCNSLASFIVDWMRQRETEEPEKWRFCEYAAKVLPSGTVEAFCELMPADEVEQLARAVGDSFDFVAELRLGEPEPGSQTTKRIDWFDVPGRRVEIDGDAVDVDDFAISFTAITVGQYCEFLDVSGWKPIPDRMEDSPGYTINHFKMNYGQSPKIPLFGITYDDATAFCGWSGYRLPTDAELRLFYETVAAQTRRKFKWDGENWTSTPGGDDRFYVRQGPFAGRPADDPDQFRKPLHRHHYEHLEAPSFRIVKP